MSSRAKSKDLAHAYGTHAIACVSQASIVRLLVPLGMTKLVRTSAACRMKQEPIARQFCDLLQRAWFFKEMGRTGNDLQLYFAAHLITSLFVEVDDDLVLAAHDE